MIYCGSFVHVLRVNILRSFIISLKHVWRRREERFTVLSQNNTSDRVNGFLSVSGLCKCVFSSLCPTSFSNLVCVWVFTKKPLSCMKVIVILRLCVCLTVNGCVCDKWWRLFNCWWQAEGPEVLRRLHTSPLSGFLSNIIHLPFSCTFTCLINALSALSCALIFTSCNQEESFFPVG